MRHVVKGVDAWSDFQYALHHHKGGSPQSIILDRDNHQEGWQGAGDCAERIAVPGRAGWRYDHNEVEGNAELDTVYQAIGLEDGEPNLKNYHATLWEEPDISVSVSFDCDHGLMIRHLAYLRYTDDDGQPHHTDQRWSDVAWALYELACPDSLQNLQYVVVPLINNPVTKTLLEEIGASAGHWDPKKAKEHNFVIDTRRAVDPPPSSVIEADCPPGSECDFFSLLHTPNVIGVLYLLKDRMSTMGYKSIKSISFFHNCVYQNAEGTAFVKWAMFMKLG